MFFELVAVGIFVAAALFNVEPADKELSISNGVSEIKSAPEEWVVALRSDQAVFYTHPGSIRKNRDRVKMWQLTDYKNAVINGDFVYLSKKSQEEYDCKEGHMRLLYTSLHSKNMGMDEALYTHAETFAWEPVMQDTNEAAMWKIACAKN